MNINTLLGIGLAAFGGYSIYTYTGDTTPLFWLKYLGISGLGLGVAGWNTLPLLKNIKLPTLPVKSQVKEIVVKELNNEIKIEDSQEQDSVALFYLTERLKGDPEAVELLRKLNDKLFSLHHPIKVEEKKG